MFSPDGRWVAYTSNEGGHRDVYVEAFPASGARWQISNGGGTDPAWRKDGAELFYVAVDRNLMAVPIKTGDRSIEQGVPQRLFPVSEGPGVELRDEYAAAADGQRFLVSQPAGQGAVAPITVILNWTESLKK